MRRWTLTLVLRSPFATRGLAAGHGVDTPLARDGAGRVIVPGTLMRGLLRDAARRIALAAPDRPETGSVAALFGCGSGAGREAGADADAWRVANEPLRRLIDVTDLVTPDAPTAGTITRVSIDPNRGSVREGHLQVIELPYPLGREVTFTGTVTLHGTRVPAEHADWLLRRALALVPAVGAFKSAGFGAVVRADLSPAGGEALQPAPAAAARAAADAAADAADVLVALTFDRPFLVNAERAAPNLFKGDAVVPGAVLKGALAETLSRDGLLCEGMGALLSGITVGHAWPVAAADAGAALTGRTHRRRVLPLSLAKRRDRGGRGGGFVDRITAADATDDLRHGVPTFEADWKDGERADAHVAFGIPAVQPARDVRVRTAFDSEKGIALYDQESEAGQLFVYSAVVPTHHVWVSRWAMPEDADPSLLAVLRRRLAAGLPGIGKTRAVAAAEVHPLPQDLLSVPALPKEGWSVTLESDALINDLGALRDGRELAADYAAYWEEQGFTLVRFFARQRLAGGYQALRYPQRDDRYEPYLLTCAGSAFLLMPGSGASPEEARRTLGTLVRSGLPLAGAVARPGWRHCPFVPQNGFGAIAAAAPGLPG